MEQDQILEYTQNVQNTITELAITYVPKLAAAILVWIIGGIIIKSLLKGLNKALDKKSSDVSLHKFLSSLVKYTLFAALALGILSILGIEMTSFVAILGAASLAVGLALQGSLSNFAGGVVLLILRPFKVGDVIEAQGFIALVHEIQIFHTIMKTYDNKTIIVPNGPLANGNITNYSTEETRVVEWVFGIGYNDDIDKAKQIIEETVFSDERILDTKEDGYYINVSNLGDSSVDIKVRARVKQADYWGVLFDKTEGIKKAFDANGVSIPFPQRDVHLFNRSKRLFS